MGEPNYLFSKYDWFAVQDHQKKQLTDEVAKMDGNRLLNTSPDDLCDYFEDKYRVNVPLLIETEIVADQNETQIDVSRDFLRAIRDRSRLFISLVLKWKLQYLLKGTQKYLIFSQRLSP